MKITRSLDLSVKKTCAEEVVRLLREAKEGKLFDTPIYDRIDRLVKKILKAIEESPSFEKI